MKNNKVLQYMLGGYCSFLAGMMIDESFNDFNLFYCFLLFIMIPSVCVYKSHQIFLRKKTTTVQKILGNIILIAHWIFLCMLAIGMFLSLLLPNI